MSAPWRCIGRDRRLPLPVQTGRGLARVTVRNRDAPGRCGCCGD
jgi:hypothetical protein